MKKIFGKYSLIYTGAFLILYCSNVYWGGTRWKGFFLSDSNGYYAYLPATFIYHDLSYSFIDSIQANHFPTFGGFDFRKQTSGAINKWYCGTAVAMAPFFLLSHAVCLMEGGNANGYGYRYAWGLNLGAIFYCLLGLFALKRILSRFFSSDGLITLLLLLTLFATNLFYYSTSEPAMSHVYSFAFFNLFVLSMLRFKESQNGKFLFFSGLLLGMITLIRPINAMIVFILPFLFSTKDEFLLFLRSWRNRIPAMLAAFAAFTTVIFIQLLYYKLQSGHWLVYSYGDEKMDFLDPHLFDFLFSYKKGLFVYLPLTFLASTGFVFLYRAGRWRFYSLLMFLLAICYLFSCWWNWWYGGSFGMRPIIDYLFIFALLLGWTIEGVTRKWRTAFITACFACLVICQVQTYQYRYYFIHWDQMNKERYWKVFMRIDLLAKKENPNGDLLK